MKLTARLLAFIAGATLLLLPGCTTNPVTGRSQLKLESDEGAIREAAVGYAWIIARYRASGAIETNTERANRVNEITQKLVTEAVKMHPASARWHWEMHIVRDPEANASCMAGGKMRINTGMWTKIRVTDEEIAQVIGHEIGHALSGHTAERASIAKAVDFGTTILAAVAARKSRTPQRTYDDTLQLSQYAALLAIKLPYSREQESEADRIGIELAARAGFDPRASVTLWQKMGAARRTPPEFRSTHPSPENRAAALAALIPKFDPVYKVASARDTSTVALVRPVTSSSVSFPNDEGPRAPAESALAARTNMMSLLFPAPSKAKTPDMMTAVMTGDIESVAYFLEQGVDINNTGRGSTYLIAAVDSGNIDMVRFLIAYGAEVNRTDRRALTPMMHAQAARPPDRKLIEVLRAFGGRTWQ